MSEPHDTSPEAQARRNSASDWRFFGGCQLSFMLFALLGLVPLVVLYPFTDSVAVIYLASAVFNMAVVFAALRYRRSAEIQTMRRSAASWLVIIASGGAVLFFALWVSRAFGV